MCTMLTALMNGAYTAIDTMLVRVRFHSAFAIVILVNYIAVLSTMTAIFIIGFERELIDGAVQLYATVGAVGLISLFVAFAKYGIRYQDERTLMFYNKYCDPNGELKDEYLTLIYEPKPDDEKNNMTNIRPQKVL
jgi:hypothetical protein